MAAAADDRFNQTQYLVRRKVFKLLGAAFHVYDMSGNVVLYSKMKAFKLREDIRLFTGEDMKTELLSIRARSAIDFSAAYDVVDAPTGQRIGVLKRKGLKSLIRDEWMVCDAAERERGLIQEDSTALALVRRFLTNLIPQNYHVELAGRPVAIFKQHFNPFIFKMTVDFTLDTGQILDRRFGLACAVLISAIEGRQSGSGLDALGGI